jgi:deoxyribodipyrimidine photo-lyase
MPPSTAIVWFRSDLRLHDHPALHAALAAHERVVPVFVFDDRLLHGRFGSGPRTAFLLGCLADLDASLRERGSALVVRRGDPATELRTLAGAVHATAVHWTSDVSPFSRARDRTVTDAIAEQGVRAVPSTGTYRVDVAGPRTQGGRPYTVFTPYWKATARLERRPVHRAPAALPPLPAGLEVGTLPELHDLGLRALVAHPVAPPGETAARAAAAVWLDDGVARYDERHDAVRGGTSVLSPYLRWGCLSARELEQRALHHAGGEPFVRQLAWRDFFAHVLLHHPDNLRREFQPRYRALEWDDDPELTDAWRHGRTGYPLVDAGMRELADTGWMHNRARMVVGSFLTKTLHQDWRVGERWFEELLLDGEPAQNNGNWQWIASTGVDPAPFTRRIFNPVRQSQRFDPDGTYLRRWVPELEGVPDAHVHEPWRMSTAEQRAAACRIGADYPGPIVDHAQERRVAIDRYRAVRTAADEDVTTR